MKYGICLLTSLSLRNTGSHKSEMVSQLLFGESFAVIEDQKEWIQIRCSLDNYVGWIEKNLTFKISEHTYEKLSKPPFWVLTNKIISITLENGTDMFILPGSTLPFFNPSKRIFNVEEKVFIINEKPETGKQATSESIVKTALSFINTPYLWGGRSLFGIDCSGFTQIVYKMNHLFIPRDASQQDSIGEAVSNIKDIMDGDLAFFQDNDRKTIHTGILLHENKIIHASGRVRIDYFNENGILSTETNSYTHHLKSIRRVLK